MMQNFILVYWLSVTKAEVNTSSQYAKSNMLIISSTKTSAKALRYNTVRAHTLV